MPFMLLAVFLKKCSFPNEFCKCILSICASVFLRTESQSGDGFYVRTLYNRQATSNNELSFKRGDILFIENTVLNGRIGTWWAYLVNENGDKLKCGTIPSKSKSVVFIFKLLVF